MPDEREIRCRHCDARNSLSGYVEAQFVVKVGDGVPHFDLEIDRGLWLADIDMECDICDKSGPWADMGYIWFPGITKTGPGGLDEQREALVG